MFAPFWFFRRKEVGVFLIELKEKRHAFGFCFEIGFAVICIDSAVELDGMANGNRNCEAKNKSKPQFYGIPGDKPVLSNAEQPPVCLFVDGFFIIQQKAIIFFNVPRNRLELFVSLFNSFPIRLYLLARGVA